MRISLLLFSIPLCLCACENEITDIGKRFEDNTRFVEVKRFEIEGSSTIRLDSFPTSALTSLANDTIMVLGKMLDRTTGTITSSSYFEVHPVSLSANGTGITFSDECLYDSLTLVMHDMRVIAGDTTVYQQFNLYRLAEVPPFDEQLPFFYNTKSVPLGDSVSTLRLLPQKGHLTYTYFKLGKDFGDEVYNMLARNETELFSPWTFLYYFKGFAIVPGKNNSTLFSTKTTFELRCYYHYSSDAQTARYFSFASRPGTSNLGMFTFTHHEHEPSADLVGLSEQKSMPFADHNYAVIQGLNGYMLKIDVPYVQEYDRYRTIVKAQIAVKPLLENFEFIPEPTRLYLYECDIFGTPQGVIAEGRSDPTMLPENKRFLFDITDYYKSRVQTNSLNTNINLLVGLPGYVVPTVDEQRFISGNVNTSFERMIVREIPELLIHYIQFK
jgi:hypothetical protein